MANDINQIVISGEVWDKPKLASTERGGARASFSLVRASGGKKQFFPVSIFGEEAVALARRTSAHERVSVVGRISVRQVKDESTGLSRVYTNVLAEDVQHTSTDEDVNSVVLAGRVVWTAKAQPTYKVHAQGPMLKLLLINNRSSGSEYDGWRDESCLVSVVAYAATAKRLKAKLEGYYRLGQLAHEVQSDIRPTSGTKAMHLTIRGSFEVNSVAPKAAGEGWRNYYQIHLSEFEQNDTTSLKRDAGIGNGAVLFQHQSQTTTFDRYTNELNPEIDATGEKAVIRQKQPVMLGQVRLGEIRVLSDGSYQGVYRHPKTGLPVCCYEGDNPEQARSNIVKSTQATKTSP